MSCGPGWIGTNSQVLHYLRVVGADRDEQGRFIITTGGVFAFLGDTSEAADAVVDSEACYLVGGKPVNLAAGLGTTSYGMRVTVIA
jgi:hypothetical protein